MNFLSVTEAAAKIGVTRNGIHKAIERGDLKPTGKTSAGYLIEESELMRYDRDRPRRGGLPRKNKI